MKVKLFVLSAVAVSALSMSGCAQMQADWVAQNCNPSAAYTDGVNDGLSPDTNMQSNFASWCATAQQTTLNAAYVKGFKDGLKGRAANAIEDNANAITNSSIDNNINNNSSSSWF